MMKRIVFILLYLSLGHLLLSQQIDERKNLNLLYNKNSTVTTLDGYKNASYHRFSKESHLQDGSGSIELIGHSSLFAISTPTFTCRKDTSYLVSVYLKNSKFPHGQNVVFSVLQGSKHLTEGYWNNSSENKWEEVLLSFTPKKSSKECSIRIYTYKHSFSTDKKNDIYSQVDTTGQTLDRQSRVFLDDFWVQENNELNITIHTPINTKKPFVSKNIRVSPDGDFSIFKNGKWKGIFPKLIYRSKPPQYQAYKEYGFNGIMDIWDDKQIKNAFNVGLKYFAISANISSKFENSYEKRISKILNYLESESVKKPYSLLMYNYDNENSWQQDYEHKIKLNKLILRIDSSNGKRNRPMYYLNGNIGLARAYKNEKVDLMDVTGTYVGGNSLGYVTQNHYPSPTLSLLKNIDGEIAPVSVIQLQSFLDNQFIPSLFYGLIQGGKAISVWRDGSYQGKFQKHSWAKNIKKVFKEIDEILPIIKAKKNKSWSVYSRNPWIKIGSKSLNGKHFLILSNHSDRDETVILIFKNLPNITKLRDFFSKKEVGTIKDKISSFTIGHYNQGYLILEII